MNLRRTNWQTLYHGTLLAWVVLLPLQTRWIARQGILAGGAWEYGTVSIYASDALILLAGAVYLVLRGRGVLHWARTPTPLAGSIAALIAIAFLSIFTAHDSGVALNAFVRLLVGVLAWWLVVQSRVRLSALALAIALSAGVESVLAFVQTLMQSISASTMFGIAVHAPAVAGDSVVETAGGRFLRAYGTLPHPNILAGWLVIGALMTMWLYFRAERRRHRLTLLVLGVLTQTGLYCTFSRSAIIAWWAVLIMATVGIFLRNRTRRFRSIEKTDWGASTRPFTFLVASIMLAGVFLRVAAPLVLTRLDAQGRLESKSVSDRLAQFRDAESLFAEHWTLGVGLGNYTNTLRDEVDSTRVAAAYQPVHFVLWLAAVELGAVGLLALLWLCAMLAFISYNACRGLFRHHNEYAPWAFCGVLLLGVLAWASLFDHYAWSLPFGIMFAWLLLSFWQRSLSEK